MNLPLRLAVCSLGVCVGVRRYFMECFVAISWINMANLWSIHNIFAICLKCIHGVFATSSLSVCYIITIQKYGFCIAKVWFLACKKGVFTLQKYGFCIAKVGILCMLLCYSELQVYVGAQFYGVCRYVNNRKMGNRNAHLIM